MADVKTLIWDGEALNLIDQRKLPFIKEYVKCDIYEKVYDAIKDMVVRGAPAIGVSASYGAALAAKKYEGSKKEEFISHLIKAIDFLSRSRPTAVNLSWALDRIKKLIEENADKEIFQIKEKILDEAVIIEKEDIEINKKIGLCGLEAFGDFKNPVKILTHCNAGALATAGYGTALGVIRSLHEHGKIKTVIVDETRPYLQGARLTAWELEEEKIPFYIITDNMAAHMMSKKEVDAVVVGADRIALNGDTANKIGTLQVSIVARYYNVPFFVAAPVSTIDIKLRDGSLIPIEERDGIEVREVLGKRIISDSMPVKNPSFDVTPYNNITAIITEKGVLRSPFEVNIKKLF